MRGKVAKALKKQAVKMAATQKSQNHSSKYHMADENYRELKQAFKNTPKHHQAKAF